jgi:hypothetical protein
MAEKPHQLFSIADRVVLVQGDRAYIGSVSWFGDYGEGLGTVIFVKWEDGFRDKTPWRASELLLVGWR